VKRSRPGSLVIEGVEWRVARVRDDAAESAVSSLTHLEVHSGVRRTRSGWRWCWIADSVEGRSDVR